MALGAGATLGLLASAGVSVYCAARLVPADSPRPWVRRPELSHILMGVVMAAMLLPPFTADRTPWSVAAAAFAGAAVWHAGAMVRRDRTGRHPAHVAMLASMAFMLVTMPPVRGTLTGAHAAHLRAALGTGQGSVVGTVTLLSFAGLLALAVERAAAVVLLRGAAGGARGSGLPALLRHPAGLPGCDAVMCAVMAGMLAPML